MPTLKPIEGCLLAFRREGREAFLLEHPNSFLLVHVPANKLNDDGWGGFNTDAFQVEPSATISGLNNDEFAAAARVEGLHILEIAKSPENPWRGRISLGRARNVDLSVPGTSVSKLHAHFTVDETSGGVRITDAGSRNGTKVNGQRLSEGESRQLAPGDQLTFGDIGAIFHTPTSLCDFLGSLFT